MLKSPKSGFFLNICRYLPNLQILTVAVCALLAMSCKSSSSLPKEPAAAVDHLARVTEQVFSKKKDVQKELGWGKNYISPISKNIAELLPHLANHRGMLVLGNSTQQIILNPTAGKQLVVRAFLKTNKNSWTAAQTSIPDSFTSLEKSLWKRLTAEKTSTGKTTSNKSTFVTSSEASLPVALIGLAAKEATILLQEGSKSPQVVELTASPSIGTEQLATQSQNEIYVDLESAVKTKLLSTHKQKWTIFRSSFNNVSPESFQFFKKYTALPQSFEELQKDTEILNVDAERLYSYSTQQY